MSDIFDELKTPSASRKVTVNSDGSVVIAAVRSDDLASLEAFQPDAKTALLAEGEGQIEIVTSHRSSQFTGMPYDQLIIRRAS